MNLKSLSWRPHRPCLLLQWPSVTVLLDCAVDLSSLSSFMPIKLYSGPRLSKFPNFHSTISYLKRYGDEVFVDGCVEVHPVTLDGVALETVDVILISNCMSLFALPFVSELSGFRGLIYTTAPILELGRLTALEFIDFIESDDRTRAGEEWKDPRICTAFVNKPTSNPIEWKLFYSREQFEKALAKVDTISFRDPVNLHGVVKITAHSSGYSVGSCNWTLCTENEKIVYAAASSSRTSHMKAADWDQFRSADAFILTSISRFPDLNPETSVCNVCAVAVDTLKKNGSVLMPVCPTGIIYDLLEVIAHHMEQQNVSQDVPLYFISPVAKETLAFSSISMEWLSEKKQEYFYLPDQAFAHGKMMKSGRLKVFNTSHGPFSRQMRTPCVIFCGHPSLRVGDAIHFLEMWGADSRNAIIMTDPDYPLADVYGPFRSLSIRAFFYPIDTRLDYTQLNASIMPDLSPKMLIMPDVYGRPPVACPQRLECLITHEPRMTFHYGDTLKIPSNIKRKRISMTPEHFPQTTFRATNASNSLAMASLDGYLSAFDNSYILNSKRQKGVSDVPSNRPKLVGDVDSDALLKRLREVDSGATLRSDLEDRLVKLPLMNAEIRVMDNGSRTQIFCNSKEDRQKLFNILASCLKELCAS